MGNAEFDWLAGGSQQKTSTIVMFFWAPFPMCSTAVLSKWLLIFVAETQNYWGDVYPPRTLYCLLCGTLRHMCVENPEYPNFLDKKDPAFTGFLNTVDEVFKSLWASGVGSASSPTEGISADNKNLLWSSGVLNTTTLRGLIRAVFYTVGKCFCLHRDLEHRNLTTSQFEHLKNPVCFVYCENTSKNKQEGLWQLKLEHKVVNIVANPEVKERYLLNLYFSKLPVKAEYCFLLSSSWSLW